MGTANAHLMHNPKFACGLVLCMRTCGAQVVKLAWQCKTPLRMAKQCCLEQQLQPTLLTGTCLLNGTIWVPICIGKAAQAAMYHCVCTQILANSILGALSNLFKAMSFRTGNPSTEQTCLVF